MQMRGCVDPAWSRDQYQFLGAWRTSGRVEVEEEEGHLFAPLLRLGLERREEGACTVPCRGRVGVLDRADQRMRNEDTWCIEDGWNDDTDGDGRRLVGRKATKLFLLKFSF
jgi:hypothetical protein